MENKTVNQISELEWSSLEALVKEISEAGDGLVRRKVVDKLLAKFKAKRSASSLTRLGIYLIDKGFVVKPPFLEFATPTVSILSTEQLMDALMAMEGNRESDPF